MICNSLIIPVLILLVLLKLDVQISTNHELRLVVSSGFVWKTYNFDLSQHTVSYPNVRPIGDFGGWGIRYNFSGETGLIFQGKNYAKVERVYFSLVDVEGFKAAVEGDSFDSAELP